MASISNFTANVNHVMRKRPRRKHVDQISDALKDSHVNRLWKTDDAAALIDMASVIQKHTTSVVNNTYCNIHFSNLGQ